MYGEIAGTQIIPYHSVSCVGSPEPKLLIFGAPKAQLIGLDDRLGSGAAVPMTVRQVLPLGAMHT